MDAWSFTDLVRASSMSARPDIRCPRFALVHAVHPVHSRPCPSPSERNRTKPIETGLEPPELELEYLPAIASPAKEGWNFSGCWSLVLGAFFIAPQKIHAHTHTKAYLSVCATVTTSTPATSILKTPSLATPREKESDLEMKKVFSTCIEVFLGVFKRSIAKAGKGVASRRRRFRLGAWSLGFLWHVRHSFSGGGALVIGPWSFPPRVFCCYISTCRPLYRGG